ncbi:uncharacterized protein LOC108907241 [Anoplophora glabripennis]|uniref:uncharacterized protein LOC108907241 n=1 Tax=Anoplophora glabripennis TaxID=217634 RepID=UPI000873E113|nr:uncharacterized protein LOC108907241 [Anoplophora glabripennis]
MGLTSKTGLTASPTKKVARTEKTKTVQLRAIAKPAPFILKRFAGLYNPYPYGCSLLCNHPIDNEAKELLRKAKDNWGVEGKNVLLAEEIEAIRETLRQISTNEPTFVQTNIILPQVESVPEELFRRYTETDSRPLTPAPTLASAATKATSSRRCVTPDLIPTCNIREKTLLVLDLRRSHSQETLSYYASSSAHEPPLIRIQHVHTRAESLEEKTAEEVQTLTKSLSTPAIFKRPKSGRKSVNEEHTEDVNEKDQEDQEEGDEEEFIKRRGKKRRKKGRDSSRGPPAFQASLDPETQMATIGLDSHNPSARPSLIPGGSLLDTGEVPERKKSILKPSVSLDIDSYLDTEILKQLRRELNEEIVDNELNNNRRKALQEALRTVTKDKPACEELVALQKELRVPPVNADLWISLPRAFSRSSARFELPMDSRSLNTMTPLDYVRENISITSARKLLYNCIFNKFKMEVEGGGEYERKVSGEKLQECLDLLMGRPLSEKQSRYFRKLVGWKESDIFDFKTCCGIFALCERLLAPQFYPQLPDRKTDPCHEVELADFEVLSRKLHGQKVDERLIEILNGIKTL